MSSPLKLCAMKRVPGRADLVASEGVPGRTALGDERAVEFLNSDMLGREHRALVEGAVGANQRAFPRAATPSCGAGLNPAARP
jgi:hypothetical protein